MIDSDMVYSLNTRPPVSDHAHFKHQVSIQDPSISPVYDVPLNIRLINVLMGGSLLGHAHVSSESAVWHPLARVSWVGLLEHTVDLLERQALGLGDEEVGVDEGAEAERAPDEEDLRTKITLDIISYCFKLLQYGGNKPCPFQPCRG